MERCRALSKNCLKVRDESYQENNWGCHLRTHGDLLQKVEGRNERDRGATLVRNVTMDVDIGCLISEVMPSVWDKAAPKYTFQLGFFGQW